MPYQKRRSRLEIIIDVLRACEYEDKPTRIMYSSNLSWKPVRAILGELVKQELITRESGADSDRRSRERYYLTDKGRGVLSALIQAERKVGIVRDNLPTPRSYRAS